MSSAIATPPTAAIRKPALIRGYEVVIGFETHAQLSTRSKIFSRAPTAFGEAPNTQACAVDLALPGTLPVMNRGAVERAIEFSLAIGAQLSMLNGIDQEYLASTQFSYPTTGVTGATLDVPEAFELTGCEDADMELLEGGRVSVTSGQIPSTFTEDSEDYVDYLEYGQWPLSYGSCTVYVESGSTAPDFFPTEHVGETVAYTTGMVKEIYGKWIIVVVDEADIVAGPTPPPARTVSRRPGRKPAQVLNKSSRRQYYPEFP